MRRSALGRKALSVLVSTAMVVSMMPTAALADAVSAGETPTEQSQVKENEPGGGDSENVANQTVAPAAPANGAGSEEEVAQVGDTTFTSLDGAFAALNSSNRTLTLLNDTAWNAATPVYYKAGENCGYVAKLTDALNAAYKANAGDITIVCRPDSDLGTMTHGHVADNITIYGNGAYVSGGECDLEVDTFQYSRETGKQVTNAVTELKGKTITINAYDVDNLGVWGQRNTDATVNVNLTNCNGKAPGATNVQRVYISGTSGVNNFTLTDCDFITAATAVYSNADGTVAISNCSFTGSDVPVNFNHKATGAQTVTVASSSFKNCGTDGVWADFAAPARFVNSGTGTLNATINGCSFAGTVGANGDILIGDGRTGQKSNEVTLTVTKTVANVQAQKPGYYGEGTTVANASLKGVVTTTEAEGLDGASIESIFTPSPAPVAEVNGKGYSSLQAAIDAAQDGETVTLMTDIVLDAQAGTESTLYPQFTISGKKLTLDMQGHKISYSEESRTKDYGRASLLTLSIDKGSDVTITGNGTIDTELGSNQAYGINILGGSNLTINNGTFYGAMTAVQVQKGGLVINDGTFLMAPTCKEQVPQYAKYIINCIDAAWKDGSATVSIKGGTFGHDYSHSPEGEGTSYLAPGYAPTANADGTYGVVAGVAQIGTKAYATLADAVAAAKDGDTITLLSDCSGNGIVVKGDTFPNGLTIDFAGHSYTVGGKLVGSAGTASNGFQLLKGNTIVMRNGSIFGDVSVAGDDTTQWSGSPAIMIQNYSNLTLDGMTVKGGKQTCYTLSNNNGDTVIKDSTITAGQNNQVGGPFAFDVCRYASYPSVSVTVEGNSVIEGCVEVSGVIGAGQNRQLTITGGTFSKPISVSTKPANIAISGGTFATEVPAEYCAGGFTPVANGDGTYGVKLAEGAYMLQDFRSGDQAFWTYPTPQDGMAFAGWYKDAAYKTACTTSDVEGAAYAKFVKVGDLITFKGGSLRTDLTGKDDYSKTSLRFGYEMHVPDGAKLDRENWGWTYRNPNSGASASVKAENYWRIDNNGVITNLVIREISKNGQAANYSTRYEVNAQLAYVTKDGTKVCVKDETRVRSVNDVAEAIKNDSFASDVDLKYANGILGE